LQIEEPKIEEVKQIEIQKEEEKVPEVPQVSEEERLKKMYV